RYYHHQALHSFPTRRSSDLMTSQNVNTDTFSNISIDIETFSDADLKKCGVYKYAESPNFEILLFAYSLDNGPVQVIDLAQGEERSEEHTSELQSRFDLVCRL